MDSLFAAPPAILEPRSYRKLMEMLVYSDNSINELTEEMEQMRLSSDEGIKLQAVRSRKYEIENDLRNNIDVFGESVNSKKYAPEMEKLRHLETVLEADMEKKMNGTVQHVLLMGEQNHRAQVKYQLKMSYGITIS